MFKYAVVLVAFLAVAFAAPQPKPGVAYTTGVVGSPYVAAPALAYSGYAAPAVSAYSPVVSAYSAAPVVSAYGSYGAYGYGAPLAYY